MRIALCLSGQPRTWRHTWETAFAYFEAHDLDVFIHTWDETDPAELQDLLATYAPKAFTIEPHPPFMAEKRRMAERFPFSPPFTIFDMFHSIAASLILALDSGDAATPYDLICRSRFDLILDDQWNGQPPPEGAVIVPAHGGVGEIGCNDQFAIGSPDTMRRYAGISAWLMDGMLDFQGRQFMPEVVLQNYLTVINGLTVVREPLALRLLREDQAGLPYAEVRHDPMFNAVKREQWEAFAKAHDLRGANQELDFDHHSRTPLEFDRWLKGLPNEQRQAVLTLPWPDRLVAIDHLLGEALGLAPMEAERYGVVRQICAALVHRMARNEPMSPQSFIVQALSANILDMRRAQDWVREDGTRVEQVAKALTGLPMLGAALKFAPPFDQKASMGWRAETG